MIKMLAVILLLITGIAYGATTEPAKALNPEPAGMLSTHSHDYVDNVGVTTTVQETNEVKQTTTITEKYRKDWELGSGVDLIVFQGNIFRKGIKKLLIPDEVVVETKYDYNNKEGQAYIVCRYNLWAMFAKD